MVSRQIANRIGFVILGLTNNFAYVIMLSAAVDLLKDDFIPPPPPPPNEHELVATTTIPSNETTDIDVGSNTTQTKYCNSHSTSTILLADTLPSLTTKIVYPFLLVGLNTSLKASVVAILSAISFIITGIFKQKVLIFVGVIFASFSSGLGESTFLSNSPLYGDVALSGWSMGTGLAGVLGSGAYLVLKMFLGVKAIMFIMLVAPVAMVFSYFCVIQQVTSSSMGNIDSSESNDSVTYRDRVLQVSADSIRTPNNVHIPDSISTGTNYSRQQVRNYGASGVISSSSGQEEEFGWREKFTLLPSLAKYFLPLLLVYFAEYFINQGIFELLYFKGVEVFGKNVDKDAQYRWFQFSYQVGVFISRSSLDLFRIKNLWAMSTLQLVNSVIFLIHASIAYEKGRYIIPYFSMAILIIIYEGLLGGFTYVNTFYRVKKEVAPDKQEFCISTVTMADSLGIVMAGLVAIPIHDILCEEYPKFVEQI